MLSRNELLWRGRDDKMVVFSIFEKVGNKEEFLLQEGYVKEPVIEQPVVGLLDMIENLFTHMFYMMIRKRKWIAYFILNIVIMWLMMNM